MSENKLSLNYKKYFKNYVHTNIKWVFGFIFSQSIFTIVVVLFILNCLKNSEFLTILITPVSAILLIIYVFLNFNGVNTYFKEITVYKHKVNVNNIKHDFKRNISITPVWFFIWILICNLFLAVILTYETDKLLSSTLISAFVTIGLNMLLIPSFLNTFTEVRNNKEVVALRYKILVKEQYYNNKNIFEDISIDENWLKVTFNKIDFESKVGIFILVNEQALNKEEIDKIRKINEDILKEYKNIWNDYFKLLKYQHSSNKKIYRLSKIIKLERLFEKIFVDFFEI